MYKILKNEKISPDSYLMEVVAPDVIQNAKPGQFVIVMAKKDSERIPLTIYDYDLEHQLCYYYYVISNLSQFNNFAIEFCR